MTAALALWPYPGDVVTYRTGMGTVRTAVALSTKRIDGQWVFDGVGEFTRLPVWGFVDQIVELSSVLPDGYHAVEGSLTVGCSHNDGTVCDDTCLRDEVVVVDLENDRYSDYETYWVSDPAVAQLLRATLAVYKAEDAEDGERIALVEQAVAVERVSALLALFGGSLC
jgi:hypothetical protein